MDFETAYRRYRREITALARPFLDLDADDVASEMTVALWRASETYDRTSGTPFGVYWWSVWRNRRADLAAKYHAQRRVHPDVVPPDDPGLLSVPAPEPHHVPLPPPGASRLSALVWMLVATGFTVAEIRLLAEISKRGYYSRVGSWRTPEVHDLIMP